MKSCILFSLLLLMSLTTAARNAPLDTVDSVDVNRYLGKWYEIAKFPNNFQKGCVAAIANYSLRPDGDIKVVNQCRVGSPEGELQEGVARAWSVADSNAKLKVQFFLRKLKVPFLAGDYWVLHLDEDYQYVLVGEPSRKFLWILSRTPNLNQSTYEMLVKKAQDLNFDTTKLVKSIR